MTTINPILRGMAMLTGGFMLAAIANATVAATGATEAHELTIWALAAGVFFASVTIPTAWADRRYIVCVALGVCLMAGEGFNLIKAGERELASRAALKQPAIKALADRETAEGVVAEAALALRSAQDAVSANAAKKDCVKNCAALLTQAVARAERALADAKADLAAVPVIALESPSQVWVDLLAAALGSIGLNGLAAALIAFGAHGANPAVKQSLTTEQPRSVPMIMVAPEPVNDDQKSDTSGQSDYSAVSDYELAKVAALFRRDVDGSHEPDGGGKVIRPRRWQRDEIRADLATRIARGESFPSQRAMAEAYGVPTTTLHEWFKAWIAEGQEVQRQQIGRRKRVG